MAGGDRGQWSFKKEHKWSIRTYSEIPADAVHLECSSLLSVDCITCPSTRDINPSECQILFSIVESLQLLVSAKITAHGSQFHKAQQPLIMTTYLPASTEKSLTGSNDIFSWAVGCLYWRVIDRWLSLHILSRHRASPNTGSMFGQILIRRWLNVPCYLNGPSATNYRRQRLSSQALNWTFHCQPLSATSPSAALF